MDKVNGKLTVFFEEPFWVGIFERIEDGKLSVAKVTFGAEPKDYEVQEYIQKCYFSLKFSPVIETVVKNIKRNPKRMQREAKKQMLEIGIGTKSQQALKLQQEQNKQERKEKSRKKKEAEEQRMFELKDPFYPLPLRHLQRLFLHAPYSRTGIRCIIPEVLLF